MTTLSYDDIKKICKDWVMDPDTMIAMECDWTDWLVEDFLNEYTQDEIMQALNVDSIDYAIPIPVYHEQFEYDMDVYVAIKEKNGIRISTRVEHMMEKK